jgi:murein DD-endopeptidase MepM/ murein hydrolase activator NlpD
MTGESSQLERVIAAIEASNPAAVMEVSTAAPAAARLDLSLANPVVAATDFNSAQAMTTLVEALLEQAGATVGIGGYGEKRGWYARGEQFSAGAEVRSVHLGVDIWAPAGAPVCAPYDAVVHSAQDNDLLGDYGPTVILAHSLEGETFFTLYGHLSRESLLGKEPGARISRGEEIGTLGSPAVNGQWPSHLHFQIILDMLGKVGDFPGVSTETERERFLALCPDPNLILRSPLL